MLRLAIIGAFLGIIPLSSGFARSVFLNGIDISSANGQRMDNVSVMIDNKGNVFITGPQYTVNEEDTYLPLRSFLHQSQKDRHKPAGDLPGERKSVGSSRELPPSPAVEMKPAEPQPPPTKAEGETVPKEPADPSLDPSAADQPAKP